MPIASAGNVITSSAQLGADVVLTSAIKNGEILNADINAAAAISGSKLQALTVGANAGVIPSTGIVNAHLSGTAGITDANLATISTASKVDGSALYNLGNVPAGAGTIPSANVAASVWKCGDTTKNAADASGTQTIAHGLGKTPTKVRITCKIAGSLAAGQFSAEAIYNGTTQASLSIYGAGSTNALTCNNTFRLGTAIDNSGANYQTGVVTFDGTNIYIAWTKTGSPTGTYTLIWEAV